jgi:hypothetical protein
LSGIGRPRELFRCREKVQSSTREQNPRSEPTCHCPVDARQFRSDGKISAVALCPALFALAHEMAAIRRPVPLGAQNRGKIVKWRARGVVAASGRPPLARSGNSAPVATTLPWPRTRRAERTRPGLSRNSVRSVICLTSCGKCLRVQAVRGVHRQRGSTDGRDGLPTGASMSVRVEGADAEPWRLTVHV